MSAGAVSEPFKQRTALPTLLWRGVLMTLGIGSTLLASYFALLSDARNDQRYVQLTRYQQDRERDREIATLLNAQINDRLRQQDKKLDEIAGDIKTLLRESRGGTR